ncbi:ABC transporter ATP-binding protein [Pollutimonas nitritireducens]|uniref:ABC transporter ATP-binding protein n=1 Tax=Pollutimonas nitritireducens TaxID=2045209 RepID=A0A2N4UAK9_9BURK|nr:ABC transporter transmembrane domain-containing protein [Pollutimonas nitritireducens]PLC52056.1 ABC transporter ATP-binding protein [Pollutimonas nitritireducens]
MGSSTFGAHSTRFGGRVAGTSAFARREIFKTVGQVLWRFRRRSAAALALLVAAKLLAVLVPVVLKHIVDALDSRAATLTLPVFLLIGYALLRFASSLFTELRDLVFARVTQTAVADFTVRMFDHLHSLGVMFMGGRQTGVLSRDVERGTAGIGFLLGTALFTVLPTLIEIGTVVVIMMMAYRLGFAAIVLTTFVAYAIFTVIFTERRTLYQRQMNELDSAASGHLVDSLLNYETVKFYASDQVESQRLRGIMKKWIGISVENQRALSVLHVGQSGIIAFGVAAIMLLAGQEVVSGSMAVGDLILVNAYVIQVCLPLNTLGTSFRQTREALINAERMSELLRYPPESDPHEVLPALQLDGGAVEFSGVDFSYEPGRQILFGVDFRIERGMTVAVVGGSGSGKSTLARLLLHFYDVDAGSVRVGATPADVIEAAKAARIHELIQSLPAQYETLVGERGVKLSGGERQRIAIARVVLKNPPLLVFDEATSALDTRTERAIQGELDRLAQGRSTLIIAHRLSTIVDADTILVMDHGRIVERGSHLELLRAKGLYAQMWNLQRQQSELDESGSRLSAQPVNLVTLVAGVLDAMRGASEAQGIVLYPLISRDTMRVTGDPSALQQLLCDLLENAIAFTPTGGRLELRLERSEGCALISVTDGRLSSPEDSSSEAGVQLPVDLPHLLDPLAVTAMLEQMGGSFDASPASDGSGMVFSIRLPLRAVASLASPTTVAPDQDQVLEGLRIFIADDQQEARELLAAVLQDHGAQAELFDSGDRLLSRLHGSPEELWPDVLVCDISLGEPDGYQVITEIRKMEAERGLSLAERLPAIALSGYSEREDRLRALLAGFQVHVGKPVDPRELLATILAVTRSKHAPDKSVR